MAESDKREATMTEGPFATATSIKLRERAYDCRVEGGGYTGDGELFAKGASEIERLTKMVQGAHDKWEQCLDSIGVERAAARELADAIERDLEDGDETKVSMRTLNAIRAIRSLTSLEQRVGDK